MIPLWIGKFIATRAIKAIKHKIDLNKIDKYVNKPNELDKKIKVVEKRIKKLEKSSHPPQEFICCRRCGCEIAKTKKK
jgi:hypothetical protein